MAFPANMNTVQGINSRLSSSEDLEDNSEATSNKTAASVVLENERQARPRTTTRIKSIRDVFNEQSLANVWAVLRKFGKFMGPGAIISVAYIDPDNFQTSVSSGAQFKYKLLFMVLVSNIIAIFLQVGPLGLSFELCTDSQVTFYQVGDCDGNEFSSDEPSTSSKVAQYRTMAYG